MQTFVMGITAYLWLGTSHILLGFDHLLFVSGMVLLIRERWPLFKAITAFTVGHSLSLAIATLGPVAVSGAGLEAAIALSIVFLAAEIIQASRGRHVLTLRNPWIACGGLGALHGLGFSGALHALHPPVANVPAALLGFNLGIEAGQMAFIATLLLAERCWRRLDVSCPEWAEPAPAYAIGAIGSFWFAVHALTIV